MIRLVLSALLLVAAPHRAQEKVDLALRDFSLELRARWEPLTDTVYKFEQQYALVRDLKPAVEKVRYGAESFRPFLPPEAVAVGDSWRIEVRDVLPMLRQLHPGATSEMHHDGGLGVSAPGGFGCLRLLDDAHAEICFRVHADFLIAGSGGRRGSSWYTPAQFRGRMVIDRKSGKVVAFEWKVPEQSANVDVNVADGDGIVADIGRTPVMELAGGSAPTFAEGARQISEYEADDTLASAFYPFAEIEWLDLAEARAESRETGKPLHVVALFGSLLDESC
jgi:hypothetical protein